MEPIKRKQNQRMEREKLGSNVNNESLEPAVPEAIPSPGLFIHVIQ